MKNALLTKFLYIGICLVMLVSLPSCSTTSKETISVSGAFAIYPLMVQWAEEYQELHPEVRIDVTAGGAGKGMSDTLSGAVDIGMISREIKAEEISKGAFGIAVTKDAVFPVVSAANPYLQQLIQHGLTRDVLVKIYISGEITNWGQALGDPSITDEIHVYTRSDAAGASEMWAKFLGGSAQEDLIGVGISGDPGLLDAVVKDPLGIGYNNLNYAFDMNTGKPVNGVLVLPVDINQNNLADSNELFEIKTEAITAVLNGDYPSPPARILYLATKGAPTGVVRDFILWILTDGQQYVEEAGYINLESSQLAAEVEKLKP